MLFGVLSSTAASLPLNTAFVAPRALDAAWPLKLVIQAWSGCRFTLKRTTTRWSERRSSNAGSPMRWMSMMTPSR